MKFAIQTADRNSHEAQTVAHYCIMNKIERYTAHSAKDVLPGSIPVGRVDWVEQVIGHTVVPDYYPEFLQSWLHRKIWQPTEWPKTPCFIKPSDRHKRFTGFVTKGGWKGKKKGPWWASEIVQFVSEWRYYVVNGELRTAKWGSGVECEPPILDIKWPINFSGAVDFGSYPDGTIALIESNSPFSCGWYDSISKGDVYVKWLVDSWNTLIPRI